MKIFLHNVGVVAPGVPDWWTLQARFADPAAFDPQAALPPLAGSLLPANERRRTTPLIQIALQVAQEAGAGQDELASVFASSCGDLLIVDRIMQALTLPSRPVSPTQFHNSVHNAPAGYWSILSASSAPSTSISAWDATFSVGLVEAATQVISRHKPVLLVACDAPAPPRLSGHRAVDVAFAVALVLKPEPSPTALQLSLHGGVEVDGMEMPDFETLRLANPAARALPLLYCLAAGNGGMVRLPYTGDQCLQVQVSS